MDGMQQPASQPRMLSAAPAAQPQSAPEGGETLGNTAQGGENQGGEKQSNARITIAGTEIVPGESASGSGWSYDVQDGSGSIVLVNYDGAAESIQTTASGVTIKAAGLNRLAELSVDGDIDLVGTGILLVDKIEMSEGSSFNLHANSKLYGENGGSVAVFLKQEDGTYLLMNGGVDAILDEAYTIPAGVTLVVPGGSQLVLQCLAVGQYTSTEGVESTYYSTSSEGSIIRQLPGYTEGGQGNEYYDGSVDFFSTAAALTIQEDAKLVISQQAALIMNMVSQRYAGAVVPTLNVQGELELGGSAAGSSWAYRAIVDLSGTLSGTGTISDAEVFVRSPQETLSVSDSVVRLEVPAASGTEQAPASAIGTLSMDGSNVMSFLECSIGELVLQNGASVRARGSGPLSIDQISGSGSVDYDTGSFILGSVDGNVSQEFSTPGTFRIGDQSYIAGPDGLVAIPAQSPGSHIPVVNAAFEYQNETSLTGGGASYSISASRSQDKREYIAGGTSVTYKELVDSLLPTNGVGNYIEVYTMGEDGALTVLTLTSENAADLTNIPAADIRLIRTLEVSGTNLGTGGGTSTSTNTAYTGSGTLGGSGAGSVTGGGARPILSGTGIHKPAPDNQDSPKPNGGDTGNENVGGGNAAENPQDTEIWVEPEKTGESYMLCAAEGEKTLEERGGRTTVSMRYTPLADSAGRTFYVVFHDDDGKLHAIRASYSRLKGELRFEADMLGHFVIVAFDFDGEEFSDAFYEALAQQKELQQFS